VKLNLGVAQARGTLCLKMDDDDWYGPAFLESMVAELSGASRVRCYPTVAYVSPCLLFDLARWEVRESDEGHLAGGTLLFARDDWEEQPFRPLPRAVDFWFVIDQILAQRAILHTHAITTFLQIRHHGDHLWTYRLDDQVVEEHLQERPLFPGGPEALLPEWVLSIYRRRHEELLGQTASRPPAAPIASAGRPLCPLGAAPS
jgi:hypothetical protein